MIGVTGAAGQLGRLVIDRLIASGQDVVALARTPEKAQDLGVAVREADYSRPETLDGAFEGVGVLLLISSNNTGEHAEYHCNVIAAAKAQGVQRIVYTSMLHADRSPLTLAENHRYTEAALKDSGVAYTILRNGWYTENHTALLKMALEQGEFVGSSGVGRISSAVRADYADAAALVLMTPGYEGKTFELAGDESWSMSDLASEVSRQTGRTIPYRNLSAEEYEVVLVQAGVPAAAAKRIAFWGPLIADDNALFDDQHQLSTLLERPTVSLADAIAVALAS